MFPIHMVYSRATTQIHFVWRMLLVFSNIHSFIHSSVHSFAQLLISAFIPPIIQTICTCLIVQTICTSLIFQTIRAVYRGCPSSGTPRTVMEECSCLHESTSSILASSFNFCIIVLFLPLLAMVGIFFNLLNIIVFSRRHDSTAAVYLTALSCSDLGTFILIVF